MFCGSMQWNIVRPKILLGDKIKLCSVILSLPILTHTSIHIYNLKEIHQNVNGVYLYDRITMVFILILFIFL